MISMKFLKGSVVDEDTRAHTQQRTAGSLAELKEQPTTRIPVDMIKDA